MAEREVQLARQSETDTTANCEGDAILTQVYHCLRCKKMMASEEDLLDHLRSHGEVQKLVFQCGKCQEVLQNESQVATHDCSTTGTVTVKQESKSSTVKIMEKGEKSFVCKDCGKVHKKKYLHDLHVMSHTGEKPFHCVVCEKGFAAKSTLKLHMRTHTGEKAFECAECGKAFSQKQHLKYHESKHTGEKPFQCMHCDKRFVHQNALKLHLRLHSGEKPFECHICQRTFTQKQHLVYHMAVHTAPENKPFKCNECHKGFSQQCALNIHKRLHTGEKPYVCTVCDKAFCQKQQLNSHGKVHVHGDRRKKLFRPKPEISQRSESEVPPPQEIDKTEASASVCSVCQLNFKSDRGLKRHMTVHNPKKFKCDTCDTKFNNRILLNKHLKVCGLVESQSDDDDDEVMEEAPSKEKGPEMPADEQSLPPKRGRKRKQNKPTIHKSRETSKAKPMIFVCLKCGNGFSGEAALLKHPCMVVPSTSSAEKTSVMSVETSTSATASPKKAVSQKELAALDECYKCFQCSTYYATKKELLDHASETHIDTKTGKRPPVAKSVPSNTLRSSPSKESRSTSSTELQKIPKPSGTPRKTHVVSPVNGPSNKVGVSTSANTIVKDPPQSNSPQKSPKTSVSKVSRTRKVTSAASGFDCPECQLSFSRLSLLSVHLRNHSGSTPKLS